MSGPLLFGVLMLGALVGVLLVVPARTIAAQRVEPVPFRVAWWRSLRLLVPTLALTPAATWLGGVSPTRVVAGVAVLAALYGVVVAIALCCAEYIRRTTRAVTAAYATLLVLTAAPYLVAIPVLAGFAIAYDPDDDLPALDHAWVLAAPSPVFVLADALPPAPTRRWQEVSFADDPLARLRVEIRCARDWRLCDSTGPDVELVGAPRAAPVADGPPIWPYGLAFDLVVSAGAVVLTARRTLRPEKRAS